MLVFVCDCFSLVIYSLVHVSMEEEILDLNWSNVEVKEAGSRTLIGRIMSKRSLNRSAIRSMILKAWNPKKEVKIVDGEDVCFLFSFEDNGDCGTVLRDRPWLIMGLLLIGQERMSFMPIQEV